MPIEDFSKFAPKLEALIALQLCSTLHLSAILHCVTHHMREISKHLDEDFVLLTHRLVADRQIFELTLSLSTIGQ